MLNIFDFPFTISRNLKIDYEYVVGSVETQHIEISSLVLKLKDTQYYDKIYLIDDFIVTTVNKESLIRKLLL